MTTLYVDRKGFTLTVRRNTVELRGEAGLRTIPLSLLERIVIHHNCELESNTLLSLSRNAVSLVVLSRRGDVAQLLGKPHNRANLRLSQYHQFAEENTRRLLSSETVLARLVGERDNLNRAKADRPDISYPLSRGIDQLQRQIENLQQQIDSLELPTLMQLRGVEGGAAANYFRAYAKLFPEALGFVTRKRRPPPDPVNAILSLGYTLLHSDAVRAAWGCGLDPWVGYYHDLDYGRESLASDLIESHRHRVELFTWELFQERHLVKDHFSQQKEGIRLNKSGRKMYYQLWEQRAIPLRRLIRKQGYRLGRWIAQNGGMER